MTARHLTTLGSAASWRSSAKKEGIQNQMLTCGCMRRLPLTRCSGATVQFAPLEKHLLESNNVQVMWHIPVVHVDVRSKHDWDIRGRWTLLRYSCPLP